MKYTIEIQFFGGRGASYYGGRDRQKLGGGNRGRKGKVHPIDIARYQGKSLSEIENDIRVRSRERLFVFDKDGNVIQAYQGTSGSVSFPVSVLDIEGATVTHNHPKGYEDFGGTFSFADVYNTLDSKWSQHRAVASGQGEFNYILRKKKGTKQNAADFKKYASKNEGKILDRFEKRYNQYFDEKIKSGSSVKTAMHYARQKSIGIINRFWQNTAPKYGYEYVKINKKYDY